MKYLRAYPELALPPSDHPKFLFTPTYLAEVQARAAAGSADWIALRTYVDTLTGAIKYVDDPVDPGPTGIWAGTYQAGSYTTPLLSLAVAYMICKDGLDTVRANFYLGRLRETLDKMTFWDRMYDNQAPTVRIWDRDAVYSIRTFIWLVVVYDWIYPQLNQAEKDQIIRVLNQYLDEFFRDGSSSPGYPWGFNICSNYVMPYFDMLSLVSQITTEDNPRAAEFRALFEDQVYGGVVPPGPGYPGGPGAKVWLNTHGKGGGTWEGMYSGLAEPHHWWAAINEKTSGGIDMITDGHDWLLESCLSSFYRIWPSLLNRPESDLVGNAGYSGYSPEVWWLSIYTGPYLLRLFGETTLAAQFQQFSKDVLAASTPGSSWTQQLKYIKMMYWNPDAASSSYSSLPLSYLAEGTGEVFSRNNWTTSAVWMWLRSGKIVMPSGHNSPQGVALSIVRGAYPLIVQPEQWLMAHAMHTIFDTAKSRDNPNAGGGSGKYNNLYYPYISGITTNHGTHKFADWLERPGITIYKEATDYMYCRADYLQDHYMDGNASTMTGKLCKDYSRDIAHLRSINAIVVYDRTTRGINATNERMQWHFDIPTQIAGQPTGTTRWDITCRTVNDYTTTFMGGVHTLFPNGATVNRTSLYTELGGGGESLVSDATGRVRDASSSIAVWAGDIGDTLTITVAGTGFALGEYTVTDVVGGWAILSPVPVFNQSEGVATLTRRTITTGYRLKSDAVGKVAFHPIGVPATTYSNSFLQGFKGSYITIWGIGDGFTLGNYQITSISASDGYATLATNPGNSKTGGWWHVANSGGSRDSYRLNIVPPSGPTNTWLTTFQVAASSGAVQAAKAFSGTGYEGCEVGTWAVVFPKIKTGYGNPPSYTVTTTLLRHIITGLIPNTDYSVACRNAGNTLRRTLSLTSSAEGILDFTATTDEVKFAISMVTTVTFTDVTALTNLGTLWTAFYNYAVAGGWGAGWFPCALSAADFANSGKIDLVVTNHSTPGSRIFTNSGLTGGYSQFADNTVANTLTGTFDTMPGDGAVYVLDWAGTGKPSLLSISDEGTSPRCHLALNDGTGKFDVSGKAFSLSQARLSVTTASNRPDIVGFYPSFQVLVNNGSGSYTSTTNPGIGEFVALTPAMTLPAMAGLLWPICRKVNLGGTYGEVIFVNFGEGLYAGKYAKLFVLKLISGSYVDVTDALGLPTDSPTNGKLAGVYDFNNDGLLDILITGGPAPGVWINDGAGHLTQQYDGLAADLSTTDLATVLDFAVDFNEDGLPELGITTFRDGWQTAIYQNINNHFTRVIRFNTPNFGFQFVVADFNEDGRPDVAVMTSSGPRLYYNTTTAAGNWINVKFTSGPAANLMGVDATIKVYTAGHLDDADYLLASVKHNTPGSPATLSVNGIGHSIGGNLPIHIGLGTVASVDVRVTYPGGSTATALAQSTDQTISL